MTNELETFMTEELGIIDRLGTDPLEGLDLFEDVGGNIWTLDQVLKEFNDSKQSRTWAWIMKKISKIIHFFLA